MTDLETLKQVFRKANLKIEEEPPRGGEIVVYVTGHVGDAIVYRFSLEGALTDAYSYE